MKNFFSNMFSKIAFRNILLPPNISKCCIPNGFAYDKVQDIFYSTKDAWQNQFGYCKMYDDSCALSGMIIDCESFYFTFDNQCWLVEFWKGQYNGATGAQIGVYSVKQPSFSKECIAPHDPSTLSYSLANNQYIPNISFTLFKEHIPIFSRNACHRCISGFKPGLFSHPSQLSLYAVIKFPKSGMQQAFFNSALCHGYTYPNLYILGDEIHIIFERPSLPLPFFQESLFSRVQAKNKFLCSKYQLLTSHLPNSMAKLELLCTKNHKLYKEMIKFGKTFFKADFYE